MDYPQIEEDDGLYGASPLDVVEHVLSAENLSFDRTDEDDLRYLQRVEIGR